MISKTYEDMLPKAYNPKKFGSYPVVNSEEWNNMPNILKGMDWMPVKTKKLWHDGKYHEEVSYVKNIIFHTEYLKPYGVRADIKVHRQEFQKIMMCYFDNTQCHLYSVCQVEFENGVIWGAEWRQDRTSGAYALYGCGHQLGVQGGFLGHIPQCVYKTNEGWKWNCNHKGDCISHYQLVNPFN